MGTNQNACGELECASIESCMLAKCSDDLRRHGMLRPLALGQCADDQYGEILRVLDSEQRTLLETQARLATICVDSQGSIHPVNL